MIWGMLAVLVGWIAYRIWLHAPGFENCHWCGQWFPKRLGLHLHKTQQRAVVCPTCWQATDKTKWVKVKL